MPLILPHHLAYPASTGAVTQLRRPVRHREAPQVGLVQRRIPYKPSEMHSLGTYVERDGERRYRAIGRVEILEVRHEPLRAITLAQAKAEGYESIEDMLEDWAHIARRATVDLEQETYVVRWAMTERRMLHRHSERGYTDVPEQALPGTGDEPPADWMEAETRACNERWEISKDIARAVATRRRKYEQLAIAKRRGDRQKARNLEADISRLSERVKHAA